MSRAKVELATRLLGGVWGHLVGDAVGVPYEFRQPIAAANVRFGAAGSWNQPPGTWSDDGALMLALLDSLLQPGGFDPEDQGRRIVAWADDGHYTPDRDGRFDIGNATRAAVDRLKAGVPAEQAGGTGDRDNGNGSLMRILPLALVHHEAVDGDLVSMAHRASRVTHGTQRAQGACALYVLIASRLLRGMSRSTAMAEAQTILRSTYAADADRLTALDHLEGYTERGGKGSVWDSFWSAWDAFAGASSYQATIERAVAYGNDTDTTAAIAGGLAGIRWTIDGIPPEWVAGMRGRDVVLPLTDRLLAGEGWRTSTTNPLRVNWVERSDAFTPPWGGRLGMTFLPGKQRDGLTGNHWRDLEFDARSLKAEHRVDTLLLLVEDHELDAARVPGIGSLLAGNGIHLVRFPIVDMAVTTDPRGLRNVLDDMRERLDAGRRVVVACRGGLGRTGTIVGCMLRDAGLDGDAAITVTRATRKGAIESGAQLDFVRAWVR